MFRARRPFVLAASALIALLASSGCAGRDDPAGLTPGAGRASLGVRAEVQATNATAVELRIGYLRTDGSRVELAAQTFSLDASATQRATVTFELARCLADPQRAVPGPTCAIALQLRLLRTTVQLDQQTITVPVRPGDAVTVQAPVPLLEVQTLQLAPAATPGTPGTPGGTASAAVESGDTLRLAATARDVTGAAVPGRTVTWTTSAPGVATVSPEGLVTAVGPGTATVQATGSGRTSTIQIVVGAPAVRTLALAPATLQIRAGTLGQISATLRDARGNLLQDRPVGYTTSNPAVATVSVGGVVTGVAPGTAVITGLTTEGPNGTTLQGTVAVTVAPPAVASIDLAPATLRLSVGASGQVTATAYDVQGTALAGRPITFATSDPRVATVTAAGAVQAVGVGTATITASSTDGANGATVSASATVTVVVPVVTTLTAAPATLTLARGAQTRISVVTRDAQGSVVTGRTIAFATSNPEIATVTADGVVQAVGSGTAVVTASTVDPTSGATLRATVIVSVPFPAVAALSASPTSLDLTVGARLPIQVVALDAEGNPIGGRAISFTTSNPAVALVSAVVLPGGPALATITGVSPGAALITATSTEGANGAVVRTTIPVTVQGTVTPPGGTGTITGRLFVQASGGPAAGVQLTFSGGAGQPVTVTSSANGSFTSPALPVGSYAIAVNGAPGYQSTQVFRVPVTPNGTTAVPAIPLALSGVTSGVVQGTIRDAVTGRPLQVPVTLTILPGIALSSADVDAIGGGTVVQSSEGGFSTTIGSTVTIRARASGYVDAVAYAAPVAGEQTTTVSLALSPTGAAGQTRIVLTWGPTPPDLDAYLAGPTESGGQFLVYYEAQGDCVGSPFACLDVDDTNGFGPETITITRQLQGTYRYFVNNFSRTGSFPTSGARVDVVVNNVTVASFTPPAGQGLTWNVFNIVNGQIVPVNTYDQTPTTSELRTATARRVGAPARGTPGAKARAAKAATSAQPSSSRRQ